MAWTVIWLIVGLILLGNSTAGRRAGARDEQTGARAAAADMQQLIAAKASVAMKKLGSAGGAATRPATGNEDLQNVVRQLDAEAQTPQQRLRAAIVAGELLGPDAALARIADLQRSTAPATAPADNQPPPDDHEEWRDDADALSTIYSAGADALAAPDRQRLIDRHGFFGRLALSFGRPDTDPARAAVLAEATRALIALGIFAIVVVLGAVLGLALLITWIVLLTNGRVRRAYVPPSPARVGSAFVEMFAVYLVMFLLLSLALSRWLADGDEGTRPNLAWNYLLTLAVPAAIAWGAARGVGWADLRRGLGWHAGRGLHVEAPLGVVGYVAALPLVVAGFFVTVLLMKLSGVKPTHPLQFAPSDSPGAALQLYVLACVWAPLVEETMFRGALFAHLRRRWHWVLSAAVVAFIFAAIHPQGWTFIPVLGSIGFALGLLREWRGSIIAPVVAHACNNFVMVSLLLAIK